MSYFIGFGIGSVPFKPKVGLFANESLNLTISLCNLVIAVSLTSLDKSLKTYNFSPEIRTIGFGFMLVLNQDVFAVLIVLKYCVRTDL